MDSAERVKNQNGGALLLVIMLLAILSLVGISASNTGMLEMQIATNDQDHKISFFLADSGMDITPKIVDSIFDELKYRESNSIGLKISASYEDETLFEDEALGQDRDATTSAGIDYTLDGYTVNAKIDFDNSARHAIGSDVEQFVTYLYNIDSRGNGPHNAVSRLSGTFQYVNRLPGR